MWACSITTSSTCTCIGGLTTLVTMTLFGRLADRFGKLLVFRILTAFTLIPFVVVTNLPAGVALPLILADHDDFHGDDVRPLGADDGPGSRQLGPGLSRQLHELQFGGAATSPPAWARSWPAPSSAKTSTTA